MKLRSYLTVFSVILLLPILIFAGALLFNSYKENQAELERHMLDAARALSLAVDRDVLARMIVLEALAVSEALDSGNLESFYKESRRMIDKLPSREELVLETVVLIDPSGQQVMNSRLPFGSPLPPASDPESIKQIIDTRRPAVSNLFTARVAGKPIISIGVPVIRDGTIKYMSLPVFLRTH